MTEKEQVQIAWKSIDWESVGIRLAQKISEREKENYKKWRAYWQYRLFTPLHIRIWHKITFRKTPKL
jgi:hypothetical protein